MQKRPTVPATPEEKIERSLCTLADWAEPILAAQALAEEELALRFDFNVERKPIAYVDREPRVSPEGDREQLLPRSDAQDV